MRVPVIIIAILALLGGVAYLFGGMASFFSGILMLTTKFPKQVTEGVEMSPQTIGLLMIAMALMMLFNGLLFVIFSIGTFMWKKWARLLGIFAYALNIVVCVLTLLTTTVKFSITPWIVGTFVAMLFITILAFSKKAFEKPILA